MSSAFGRLQMEDTHITGQNDNLRSRSWEAPYITKRQVGWIIGGCVLFILISGWAFFWNHERFEFGDDFVLDNGLWGTLGDFVGGTLGTILAILSFMMMYWTLKAQRELTVQTNQKQESLERELSNKAAALQTELNSQAVKQAELQRFNDLFFELLALYHRQKKELDSTCCNGRSYFDSQMNTMQNDFREYVTFGRGRRYAKDKYVAFYFENAAYIAPLFRTLYRLFLLIDDALIENDQKLDYAKTVRAQLSEGELFFLRYNCLTGYGLKFQDLVNKYRITKHLPFLSLLENTKLRNQIVRNGTNNQGLALNWIIYSLWKEIYNRIVGKDQSSGTMEEFMSNQKYNLSFAVREGRTIVIRLVIDNGYRNNTPALRCLDGLDMDEIEKLLFDFLREVFIFSSVGAFNNKDLMVFMTKRKRNVNIEEIWSYAKIKEGNLRLSHPAWDAFYGIGL